MYSIIAGVGVSILIEGVARMVEARSHIRPYWVHTGWIVFLSAVHVFSWFGLWALRNHSVWTPREIIVLLLGKAVELVLRRTLADDGGHGLALTIAQEDDRHARADRLGRDNG